MNNDSECKKFMILRKIKRKIIRPVLQLFVLFKFRLENRNKEKFVCPACNYKGPFKDLLLPTGRSVKHMKCPNCSADVRHRIQYLVIMDILYSRDTSRMKMLHIAPEVFLRPFFSKQFAEYEMDDLEMENVDHRVDLTRLPFEDETYDFILASHVLEHIKDDKAAIKEDRRVLRSNGIAILTVPIVCEKTVEYPEPNPYEFNHVRASGMDYFDRFKPFFKRIEIITSDTLPDQYQLYYYTDRSIFPNTAVRLTFFTTI